MKKIILLIVAFLLPIVGMTQEKEKGKFFKDLYKEVFKYATVYVAGEIDNSYQTKYPDYFIRTDPDNLYAIPEVVDETVYHPFDYRVGVGIRKLARFDYEIKQNYINGTENMVGLSAPTAAVRGFEYLLHVEKERQRSEEFTNSRFFIRHTGKYHIVKVEARQQGMVDFKYQSAEVRARLPIGKKFSISAGAVYRTHDRPYGYNPVEIWLNETNEDGSTANYWYTLGFDYGYDDWYYTQEDQNGNNTYNWYWTDPDGEIVAYTDQDFRDRVMPGLLNRYNNEIWDSLPSYGEVAPIVGFDFYHYKKKFWMHAYANWILPYHKYVKGDEEFSYLNRDNWGVGGLIEGSDPEQWSDYQGGVIIGWRISKTLGLFIESEYTKFWDSEIYQSSLGLNFRL